jgi:hypothetical protein
VSAKPQPDYTVLAVCGTVVALGTIAGLVLLVLFAPPDTDLVKLLGAIGTGLALVAGQVATLLKTRSVSRTVDELNNDRMDAKIRAGVADVLPEHLIDPDVQPQLTADRARRDEA